MPTIKRKVEMNLPQLIEWGWKNIEKVEGKIFKSNKRDVFGRYSTVYFSVDGYGFNTEGVSHKDIFTVEVEEEITEDTVIPKLIEIDEDGVRFEWTYKSINEVKDYQTKTIHTIIYGKFKLIWEKYKGLVD